jgi:hypothetical protein
MNFKGRAERLKDEDLPRAGARIGVGEDEIHAVLDVEARGRGFDSQGRPAMLFEPHIFYRQLSGSKRDEAVSKGLARRSWVRDYPSDSYPRLLEAMAIDKEAALRSASWGMGQIMGFNCTLVGYPTAEAMVRDFLDSEGKHLEAMVTFIINTNLAKHLRDHNWRGFARGYNGGGYEANNYHVKLEQAYNRWAGIPDTPFTPKGIDTSEPSQEAPSGGGGSLLSVILAVLKAIFK